MRCGGFGAVFMGALFVLFAGSLVMALRQGPGHQSIVGYYAALALLGGLAAFLLYFLLVQRVEIADGRLRARYLFRTLAPTAWSVDLAEVKEIVLGSIGKLKKEHPDLMKAPRLHEMVTRYESLNYRGMPLRAAVQWTPLIVVHTKNFEDTQVIITKPFSRKACRGLMAAFRSNGIAVSGDEKL